MFAFAWFISSSTSTATTQRSSTTGHHGIRIVDLHRSQDCYEHRYIVQLAGYTTGFATRLFRLQSTLTIYCLIVTWPSSVLALRLEEQVKVITDHSILQRVALLHFDTLRSGPSEKVHLVPTVSSSRTRLSRRVLFSFHFNLICEIYPRVLNSWPRFALAILV